MCQDDVAELPSWTEGARRMHEVGSVVGADSHLCPSQGVGGRGETPLTKCGGGNCTGGLGRPWDQEGAGREVAPSGH